MIRRSSYGYDVPNDDNCDVSSPQRDYYSKSSSFRRNSYDGGIDDVSLKGEAESYRGRMAKICDVIVLGVGYRLAPENRYPTTFEDGVKVLHWLSKQANLAECNKSVRSTMGGGPDLRKSDSNWHIADAFEASMVEPWLATHGNPSR
ncbi:deacetylase [Lithospermum erythrorhizon]|uniref:Deacetylase n=1 Tax=Lithospermum erythrorhizon TaxID=34254 RepID=A0AAV3P840_LITER